MARLHLLSCQFSPCLKSSLDQLDTLPTGAVREEINEKEKGRRCSRSNSTISIDRCLTLNLPASEHGRAPKKNITNHRNPVRDKPAPFVSHTDRKSDDCHTGQNAQLSLRNQIIQSALYKPSPTPDQRDLHKRGETGHTICTTSCALHQKRERKRI